MDKDQVLNNIFSDDPLGLLKVKPKPSKAQNGDERLISNFLEINNFIESNKREPESSSKNISEYQLYSRLKSLREDLEKVKILKPFDVYELLPEPISEDAEPVRPNKKVPEKKIESIDDILKDDSFDLLGGDSEGLFEFKHTPKDYERASADFVARRKPCKDFDKYKPVFGAIQKDLAIGKRKLIPFKEDNLRVGEFYVHNGILFLLESVNFTQEEKYFPDGSRTRKDGRTRCIFENGTESNMLYRSVAKALYSNGQVLTQNMDYTNEVFLQSFGVLTEDDKEAGYIYVLKSLSTDPAITKIQHLYKIGYSKNKVPERIKNAEKEPTYLMAPVKIESAFKCYNMNGKKLELLIHNFFGNSCLEVDVFDEKGKRHTPREWFIAPLEIIEQAIALIINGEIVNYTFDAESMVIKVK